MAEKHTTLTQFEMLALRGRVDSLSRNKELLDLVIQGLKEAQHIGITVTLPVAGWSNGTQTVKDLSFLADSNYWYFAYGDIGVNANNITVDGQITFRCDDVPDRELTVDIMMLKVTTKDKSDVGKVFNLVSNENLRLYTDKRLFDLCNALTNGSPFCFILGDSDDKTILDSSGMSISGRVIPNSSN